MCRDLNQAINSGTNQRALHSLNEQRVPYSEYLRAMKFLLIIHYTEDPTKQNSVVHT